VLKFVLAIDFLLATYAWLAFAAVVLGWLEGFNILNDHSYGVALFSKYLNLVVEPVLRPIRTIVPKVGIVDASPFALIIIIMAVRYAMALYLIPKLI
jgi:YggT family protein